MIHPDQEYEWDPEDDCPPETAVSTPPTNDLVVLDLGNGRCVARWTGSEWEETGLDVCPGGCRGTGHRDGLECRKCGGSGVA